MFPGPPLPLPPEFPLRQLIPLIDRRKLVGAWLRNSGAPHRLSICTPGRCAAVLIGEDLGALLRHCSQVVVRAGAEALVLEAEALIRCRAVQVVTGTPYLPCLERLKKIFPGARLDHDGFHVPLCCRAPEEVLADCRTHEIPVMGSRITYHSDGLTSSV